MYKNQLSFSVEAAELIDKALKYYIVSVLDKSDAFKEESELAEELHDAFKKMYR